MASAPPHSGKSCQWVFSRGTGDHFPGGDDFVIILVAFEKSRSNGRQLIFRKLAILIGVECGEDFSAHCRNGRFAARTTQNRCNVEASSASLFELELERNKAAFAIIGCKLISTDFSILVGVEIGQSRRNRFGLGWTTFASASASP